MRSTSPASTEKLLDLLRIEAILDRTDYALTEPGNLKQRKVMLALLVNIILF